jgi:hypothetical protein
MLRPGSAPTARKRSSADGWRVFATAPQEEDDLNRLKRFDGFEALLSRLPLSRTLDRRAGRGP